MDERWVNIYCRNQDNILFIGRVYESKKLAIQGIGETSEGYGTRHLWTIKLHEKIEEQSK